MSSAATGIPETLIFPPLTRTGQGLVDGLLPLCREYGPRGMLVHGGSLARSGVLERILARQPSGLDVACWAHPGREPTLADVESAIAAARSARVEWIAAVGGGSVMDAAKTAAGLLNAALPPGAYHNGADIEASRVPFIAVPTTAGTGSESTMVSVLTNADTGVKKSIRHPSFMARLVILDPELILSCPKHVIAASGMDALVQAVESYISRKATWFSEMLSLRAIRLVAPSLEAVFAGEAGDRAGDLLVGSYLAGVALSNARLGAVHGLAHPLGTRYHASHGLVCGVCLPAVLEFNREACVEKYARMEEVLGGDPVTRARELIRSLEIKSPFAGRPVIDRSAVIDETLASGSTSANPREVTARDVEWLLARIFAA